MFATGVLVATTPFLLGLLSVVTWVVTLANIADERRPLVAPRERDHRGEDRSEPK